MGKTFESNEDERGNNRMTKEETGPEPQGWEFINRFTESKPIYGMDLYVDRPYHCNGGYEYRIRDRHTAACLAGGIERFPNLAKDVAEEKAIELAYRAACRVIIEAGRYPEETCRNMDSDRLRESILLLDAYHEGVKERAKQEGVPGLEGKLVQAASNGVRGSLNCELVRRGEPSVPPKLYQLA